MRTTSRRASSATSSSFRRSRSTTAADRSFSRKAAIRSRRSPPRKIPEGRRFAAAAATSACWCSGGCRPRLRQMASTDDNGTRPAAERTDAELVGRCRTGDERAWAELVERYSRYVYAISVRGFRLSPHDADDVFQDTFARIYDRLDALRDDEAFRPWLAQLTRRLFLDRIRENSRTQGLDEVAELDVAADALERLDEALV